MKTEENVNEQEKTVLKKIENADSVLVGAGAGLSSSAGFLYDGERFRKYFSDFSEKYKFRDMYSGGFYNYKTPEEMWAFWSRYIFINRYMNPPKSVYSDLLNLVCGKDYFVITTNVDHCFQKAGFDKKRLFYTQGDYGLWQCSVPCHDKTYDNEETVRKMVLSQGFRIEKKQDGEELSLPEDTEKLKMEVPSELVPHCPVCGELMSMNLRADGTFVEDKGWKRASENYSRFLEKHRDSKIVYLELGVGANTPGIIKYPFWNMTYQNPDATYICINKGAAVVPFEIKSRSVCVDKDIFEFFKSIGKTAEKVVEKTSAEKLSAD